MKQRHTVVLPAPISPVSSEAAAAAHAVQQMRQRFAMAFAHEQIARIRGDGKWRLLGLK
jgi:hypothetical protein